MFKKIFVGILFTLLVTNAQQFFVEYQKIEGELTQSDFSKKDFGRYDGFTLPLNKSEMVHFLVYSEDFSPSLVILTPENKKLQQVQGRGEDYVSFGLKVPESGEWILYVVGDSSASGNYMFQYAISDSASLFLDSNADFCTGVNYLLAHSTAYFILPQTVPSKKQLYELKGATDAFINGDDASYLATFYEGNSKEEAQSKFNSLVKKVEGCVPKGWKKDQSKNGMNNNGFDVTYAWMEPVNNNPRTIRISMYDYTKSEEDVEYPNDFSVELVVMRY